MSHYYHPGSRRSARIAADAVTTAASASSARKGRRKRGSSSERNVDNDEAASRLCLPNESLDDVDPQIWSPSKEFVAFHPPLRNGSEDFDGRLAWDFEEEQSYDEYAEMARREPNEMGTGRFVLGGGRRRIIGLLDLTRKNVKRKGRSDEIGGRGAEVMPGDRLKRMAMFLETFLGLSVSVRSGIDEGMAVRTDKRGGGLRVEDGKRGLSFPLRTLHLQLGGSSCADVFSMFDVAVEYVRPTEYSLLILTDVPLGEELEDDDDGNNGFEVQEVLGRACGNRVAVVHCSAGTSDAELFGTAAHELLHTMGFDHTTYWRCLMNPSCLEGREWLFLSPHNLRKLVNFHGEEGNGSFVVDRYKALLKRWWDVFDKGSTSANENYEWLERKVCLLEGKVRNKSKLARAQMSVRVLL